MTESEISEYTDLMMTNALKIAVGFIDRNVPRDEWEDNLQGLNEIMLNESGMDEDSAKFLINAARDFLIEHGDQPEFLHALLEGAEHGLHQNATTQ